MSKELIEITSLLRMRFVTNDTCHKAAERIEELERKVASRDAEVVSLTNQRDYEYVRAENAEQERDQLREQVKMLRDAMNNALPYMTSGDSFLKDALAATEPKP